MNAANPALATAGTIQSGVFPAGAQTSQTEAARGQTAHAQTAAQIMLGFALWVQSRLPPDDPNPEDGAAELLVLVEGMVMMEAARQPQIADAAIRSYLDR